MMSKTCEDDKKIAYLSMIQGVITRMANNAFMIKGWSVTLSTAMLAVAGATKSELFCLVALVPLLLFWWLDAFFFYQEKKYRDIFDHVRLAKQLPPEQYFCLDPNMIEDRNAERKNKLSIRLSTMKGEAVYPLYLVQMIVLVVAFVIINCLP